MRIHFRYSRSKTNVTVRGFGFSNSIFLFYAVSTDLTSTVFIAISKSFSFIDDFSLQLQASEHVMHPHFCSISCFAPPFPFAHPHYILLFA